MRGWKSRLVVIVLLVPVLTVAPVLRGSRARAAEAGEAEETGRTDAEPVTPPFRPEATNPPKIERRIHSIAHELAATAKRHGNDSVALQAGLLINSLGAGAVGVTEVTVVGQSPQAGPGFLEIDVTTGIILDSEGSTPRSELRHIWQHVAGPTLKRMESFETDPRGLELVFLYGLQRFADRIEGKADPTAPVLPRVMRVAIPETVLADLAADEIDVDAVLQRSTVHDGKRVISASELGFN